ncbi:RNA helicase [Ranunculus cassubicifolius]
MSTKLKFKSKFNSKPKKYPKKVKKWLEEVEEIKELKAWIEFGKPDRGSNPLSTKSLPSSAPIGKLDENTFSLYAGCNKFAQYPISRKTKDGLKDAKYKVCTDIQKASLPHTLCGRDILGAAKTGSGKTLAFVIPVLETLFRERWAPNDGVGCIIITPTRELAGQIFDELKVVGKYHSFSVGLLIGGREDLEGEKDRVSDLNILVCTPGRLLQHLDETENFQCSQLKVLVLDEADRILDVGFKKALNAIISQLPKERQTFLFSATQTKSVKDLARLSLKNQEYISVHEDSSSATPSRLQQTAMTVSLPQKLDLLWSFIKAHLNSRILVFLSTCKQVKFVFEAFKKLRPGIPLKCLHGKMKQEKRMAIYSQFSSEKRSVLFATDVASRGLDFNKAVDWVVQVDCPENTAAYIHRVGRTARYHSGGRSVLFLMPSEEKRMLEKLQSAKIPVQAIKVNENRVTPVSQLLAALLVKYPTMQQLAQRAFTTYLKSIFRQPDKEIFDVTKLPIEEYSASLGLPMTPNVRSLPRKKKDDIILPPTEVLKTDPLEMEEGSYRSEEEEEMEKGLLLAKNTDIGGEMHGSDNISTSGPATRILKKKKLKINIHRPVGSRVVFDEEGNTLAPLAALADKTNTGDALLQHDKVQERYAKLKEEMKERDKVDKVLLRKRLHEKRVKEKMKLRRGDDESSGSDAEEEDEPNDKRNKRAKIYFGSDNEEDNNDKLVSSVSLAEQEALALKLLSSMHS